MSPASPPYHSLGRVEEGQSPSQPSSPRRLPLHFWAALLLLLPLLLLFIFTHTGTLALPATPLFTTMAPPDTGSLPKRPLRVMTFNIWLSGARVQNGMEKIAQQIKEVDPDIVALQVKIPNSFGEKKIKKFVSLKFLI